MSVVLDLSVDLSGLQSLAAGLSRGLSDLSPVMRRVPALVRQGSGGLAEQVARRSFEGVGGRVVPWREPGYVRGPLPEEAARREAVIFDAVLGRGPGSVVRAGRDFAQVGADDDAVRLRSALLGNGIVSTAPYVAFVTGELTERTSPAPARAAKRALRPTGLPRRRTSGRGRRERPKNVTPVTVRYAMFWFLGLTFGYWPTERELLSGIPTPPKNLGWNDRILERVEAAVVEHVLSEVA